MSIADILALPDVIVEMCTEISAHDHKRAKVRHDFEEKMAANRIKAAQGFGHG